jgi:hypothetical protein
MIRFLWVILVMGLLTPLLGRVVLAGDNAVQQLPAQQAAGSDALVKQQAPMCDASANKQILQTLTDIRDSQLSVLQAQVEILSLLRAQDKTPVAVPAHEGPPVPGHRMASKGHKPKPSGNLSAER